MWVTWLALLALVLYCAAEAFSIAHLRSASGRFSRTTTLLLAAGLVVQFAALDLRARLLHSVPYRDLPDSMSLFAWMLVVAYLILLLRHRERSAAPFLIPVAIVFLVISLLTHSHPVPPSPELSGSLFAFHVTVAILGYAALTLSFVLALLYLIQTRQLQKRQTGLLFSRLPALDALDRLQKTSIAVGVIALTAAAALGLVWAHETWGKIWDVKVLWTFLTIAIYVAALACTRVGWRGRRMAFVSIAGFFVLLFSYTIVNLFLSQEHIFR